jgi:probable O-glycosylation ligase (exosortase A-associated)
MRDLVLTLIVAAALPWMFRRPAVGVLFWVAFGLLNPHRFTWGFAYSLPFAQIIAITTALGILFSREPRKFKGGAATVILLIFITWTLVTTSTALVPDRAQFMLERVLKIQVGTFLALLVLYKREHVHALVWVIALSIGFFSIKGGLFTLATLGQYRVWGPPESFIAENNALALATVMTIPLWAYLYAQARAPWLRFVIFGCAALSTVAVFGSHSRGALLAVVAMLGFLWLKGRRKVVIGILMVSALPLLILFMPEHWTERMQTIGDYREEESARARIETWTMLFNLALDRPILGGGFEPYKRWIFDIYNPSFQGTYSAHSIYFQVLGEHGFPGLALFLLFWLLVWMKCSATVRLCRNRPEVAWAFWLAQMIKVSIVGYLVGGAFLNLAYWDMPYYLFVAIAVTHSLLKAPAGIPSTTAQPSVENATFAIGSSNMQAGTPPR